MNSRTQHVRSMTGFGAASQEHALGRLSIELRSVNSRFLDVNLRLPDELRAIEPMLREALAAHVRRGKVDVRAHWARNLDQHTRLAIRDHVLEGLFEAQRAILRRFPAAAPLTVADCLAFPGVIDTPQTDAAELVAAFTPVVSAAVAELLTSRAREGERLTTTMREHAQAIEHIIADLKLRLPQRVSEFTRRLTERLHEAASTGLHGVGIPFEEAMARIRQEVALYGMRTDAAEELERLSVHVAELHSVLARGGAVGKRLDFLMQEFNREANTLGSKAVGVDLGQAVVDLKLLIEHLREQVQNLE